MEKDLAQMTLEELWQLFPIELVAHRKEWHDQAAEEIAALGELLSDFSPELTHVGSTAIEGIMAKPIVDILVEVGPDVDFGVIINRLEEDGYICMSTGKTRVSFNKGYTPAGYAEKVFHIHVRRKGDNDEIYFRDYLIEHPEVAKEYESLKLSLLPKFRNDRDGYTDAKSEFVKRITEEAKKKRR